jgi:Uma2 family endonuclease
MTIAPSPQKRDDEIKYDAPPRPRYAYDEEGYAISDGMPMAESPRHRREMTDCLQCLEGYFSDAPDVYVSGNDFIHYKQGDRKSRVSPDCYVVKGVVPRERKNFKVWQEGGKTPCVIFEFTSEETQQNDTGRKLTLYEQELETAEYFLFDPEGDYLSPRLQGYRLREGRYERMTPDEGGRLWSEELGLWLEMIADSLRFFDPKTGEYLRTRTEAERERLVEKQRADAERQRAEKEAAARAQAEAEIERLRAELDTLRQQKPPSN